MEKNLKKIREKFFAVGFLYGACCATWVNAWLIMDRMNFGVFLFAVIWFLLSAVVEANNGPISIEKDSDLTWHEYVCGYAVFSTIGAYAVAHYGWPTLVPNIPNLCVALFGLIMPFVFFMAMVFLLSVLSLFSRTFIRKFWMGCVKAWGFVSDTVKEAWENTSRTLKS